MAFTAEQRQALSAKLDGRAVRERAQNGQAVSYLEGWYALSEANRIFGFDGWDRETVNLRCVWEGIVRVASHVLTLRMCACGSGRRKPSSVARGMGRGWEWADAPGEAHEAAAKEAETDATKRALVTFGNAFGLCLYDKVQAGLRRPRKLRAPAPVQWVVRPLEREVNPLCRPGRVLLCSPQFHHPMHVARGCCKTLVSQHGNGFHAVHQNTCASNR